jgi:hypothetical protein
MVNLADDIAYWPADGHLGLDSDQLLDDRQGVRLGYMHGT